MLPLFNGPEDLKRQRNINLGGATTSSSHNDLLQIAKANRAEREAVKRQRDAAVQVQAWWRGSLDREHTKAELRARFEDDITSLDAMRCLILLGKDEERLARWAEAAVEMDEGESSVS
jgi:ubiquitin-protein ligase E3 C